MGAPPRFVSPWQGVVTLRWKHGQESRPLFWLWGVDSFRQTEEGIHTMPDITFNCPHCNQSLEVPESLVGSTIFCPACQKSITFEVDAAPPMVTAQPQLNLAIKCPPSPASNPPPPQVSKSAVGPIIFDCPRCHTELEAEWNLFRHFLMVR